MQVFVPYPSPIDVAKCLDKKRLNKQIIECDQILSAIRGDSEAWKNHPVVKMYSDYSHWLREYRECLYAYLSGDDELAWFCDEDADYHQPPFLTSDFCDQHKRRLYTKAPDLYPQFASYGTSDENWYFIDGRIIKYKDGKQIK